MDDDRFRPPFGFSSGYFGSNHRSPPKSPFDEEEEESPFGNLGDDLFGRFRFGNFGRNGSDMEDIFRGAEKMLRHMDGMFRDMHSLGGRGGSGAFGQIIGSGDQMGGLEEVFGGRKRSPRDEMLKEPDTETALTIFDASTDDDRNAQQLDTLGPLSPLGSLGPLDPLDARRRQNGPGMFGSWSGSSSMTSLSSFGDGKTEERQTIQHTDGSTSVVVRRRMGDKELTVTTKTDRNGETEVFEDLINMDEDEKDDFEAGWRAASPVRDVQNYDTRGRGGWGGRGDTGGRGDADVEPVPPMLDPHAPGIFAKLFGSWFN